MNILSKTIKSGVQNGLLNSMNAMPAIVQSFNTTTQTVEALIAVMRIVDGRDEAYTLLVDIPVVLPSVRGFHLTMPIKTGDECLLVFADRCIDAWFDTGVVSPQMEHRVHHISDGFALLGVNSRPNTISDYSPDDMVLRNTANNQKITLKKSGDITIETDKDMSVVCDNINITSTGDVNVSAAGNAILNSSNTTINSPTTINGSLDINGSLTATGEVTGGGVVLQKHKHLGDSGGTTGPPI